MKCRDWNDISIVKGLQIFEWKFLFCFVLCYLQNILLLCNAWCCYNILLYYVFCVIVNGILLGGVILFVCNFVIYVCVCVFCTQSFLVMILLNHIFISCLLCYCERFFSRGNLCAIFCICVCVCLLCTVCQKIIFSVEYIYCVSEC